MKNKLTLYKKQIIVSAILAIIVGFFVYTIYTVHSLSVAVNDDVQWRAAVTGEINVHTQNIQQIVAAINKISQQLQTKSK